MATTKDDIITLPNDHLRRLSKKISSINDEVKQIVADMEAAVRDWDASRPHEVTVALAAIQIDQPVQVVIVRQSFENGTPANYDVLINPEITKREGTIETDYEGCLSIQYIYGLVPRYSKVRLKALNLKGEVIRMKADGFLARVLQHEVDHLKGKLFIDHIKNKRQAFYKLNSKGELKLLNYDKEVKNNKDLWG